MVSEANRHVRFFLYAIGGSGCSLSPTRAPISTRICLNWKSPMISNRVASTTPLPSLRDGEPGSKFLLGCYLFVGERLAPPLVEVSGHELFCQVYCSIYKNLSALYGFIVLEIRTINGHFPPTPGALEGVQQSILGSFLGAFTPIRGRGSQESIQKCYQNPVRPVRQLLVVDPYSQPSRLSPTH